MAEKSQPYTLIRADDFQEILSDANEIIEAVSNMRKSPISCGFAGVSLVRACIKATGGDMLWWCELLKNGPDSIVAIPAPAGVGTLPKGPVGKQ